MANINTLHLDGGKRLLKAIKDSLIKVVEGHYRFLTNANLDNSEETAVIYLTDKNMTKEIATIVVSHKQITAANENGAIKLSLGKLDAQSIGENAEAEDRVTLFLFPVIIEKESPENFGKFYAEMFLGLKKK